MSIPNMQSRRDGACPVCGRDHDEDCRWYSDLETILCYTRGAGGTSSVPCPPDSVPAAIGGNYVFSGMTRDDRAGKYILKVEQEAKSNRPASSIDYFYQDASGQDVVKVTRKDSGNGTKKFSQRYFDPEVGAWESWIDSGKNPTGSTIWKSSFTDEQKDRLKSQVPLYNLPVVIAAIADGKDVWFVEGEGCADVLAEVGIVGTTLIAGAGKLQAYNPKALEALHGARVILCPDRDQKGLAHMKEVAAALNGKAALLWCYCKPNDSAFWVNLQKEGGFDCKDWLDQLDGLEQQAKRTHLYSAVGDEREWSRAVKEGQKAKTEAKPQEMAWRCLESLNYQLGQWSKPEFVEGSEAATRRHYESNPMARLLTLPDPKTKLPALALQHFNAKADFDFSVEKNLTSASKDGGGGLMLNVTWVEFGKLLERQAFIKSTETFQVKDFVLALKRELGRNISCTFRQDELQALLQNRTATYRSEGGKTYRLAECEGRQSDGTMVFKTIQFRADGSATGEDETGWVYNKNLSMDDDIPSPAIAAQNPNALKKWLEAGKGFFHGETLPYALFIAGYFVAVSQHQDIMKQERRFPQAAIFGERGGGKTTALEWAASLFGMHHELRGKVTTSAIYELAKNLSCLPLVFDDPIESGKKQADQKDAIEGAAWGCYGGKPRVVRGNTQYPRTALAIATNVALGENNSALDSRLWKMFMPIRQHNLEGIPALTNAMEIASGGLSEILAIHYDRDAVGVLESQLLEFLPMAHSRVAASLALVSYFTQSLCDMIGHEFDALGFAKDKLCPTANDSESGKDSLEDFLEKLSILKSEGLAGEWNTTSTLHNGKAFLAIHLPSVWKDFEKKFSTNYSQQSISNLGVERGGESNINKKFVPDKAQWIDYLRALAEYDRRDLSECEDIPSPPFRPTKSAPRKCLIIPATLVPNMKQLLSSYDDATESRESQAASKSQVTSESQVTSDSATEVTWKTQSNQGLQAPGYQVTSVTSKTMPPSNSTKKDVPVNSKGARVVDVETGAVGVVTDVEDGHFLAIQLDKPLLQKLSDGSKVVSDSLYRTSGQVVSEKQWKAIRANVKVGDRVQYQSQFWKVAKIRADGTLDIDHATMLKATSATPAEVEVVRPVTA